jgi:Tfp pilus assembly protein PilP
MGLAGLSVDEIVMRGVVKGNSGWMALVKGVNNRSYLLKVGDELYDGSVRAITADAVLFLQNVNDPLSVARKREVRKPLRPAREAQ